MAPRVAKTREKAIPQGLKPIEHARSKSELKLRPPKPEAASLKIELGRRYRFAASHRLHSGRLSEEENTRIYGKCSNPLGHGHNYVVEISLSGEVDPATGMIANLAEVDGFVEREVLEAFDHRSLNEEVAAFREAVPTTENLCVEIFRRLKSFPQAKLERVRVEETANNSFEYTGESVAGGPAGVGRNSEGDPR
jgi:6-pyruvoyltetrahydropterin/6-carboxytetrahydropterin synthase